VTGCYAHNNDLSGPIKYGEFLDQLNECQLFQGLFSMEVVSYFLASKLLSAV